MHESETGLYNNMAWTMILSWYTLRFKVRVKTQWYKIQVKKLQSRRQSINDITDMSDWHLENWKLIGQENWRDSGITYNNISDQNPATQLLMLWPAMSHMTLPRCKKRGREEKKKLSSKRKHPALNADSRNYADVITKLGMTSSQHSDQM